MLRFLVFYIMYSIKMDFSCKFKVDILYKNVFKEN